MTHRRGTARKPLLLRDSYAYAELVRELAGQHGGSARGAAQSLGMSHAQLSRVLRGVVGARIEAGTYRGLWDVADDDQRDRLKAAVVLEEAVVVASEWGSRLTQELREFGWGLAPAFTAQELLGLAPSPEKRSLYQLEDPAMARLWWKALRRVGATAEEDAAGAGAALVRFRERFVATVGRTPSQDPQVATPGGNRSRVARQRDPTLEAHVLLSEMRAFNTVLTGGHPAPWERFTGGDPWTSNRRIRPRDLGLIEATVEWRAWTALLGSGRAAAVLEAALEVQRERAATSKSESDRLIPLFARPSSAYTVGARRGGPGAHDQGREAVG